MANFSDRVCHYPLISDSLKAASDAYSWVSSGERFRSIFQLSESTIAALKEKAKALASTGEAFLLSGCVLGCFFLSHFESRFFAFLDAVAKLDDIACHQILDRIEAVFPSVRKPTEELLGPTADCALSAAENYLEYFLPDSKNEIVNRFVDLLP